MNLDRKTIDLLWQIRKYEMCAAMPNIIDIVDDNSSPIKLERRTIQLKQGELFLLKVIDHGKVVFNEGFTDREKWNDVAQKYLDEAERIIAEEHTRSYEEGLRRMGRGNKENFIKTTPKSVKKSFNSR